jgi:hypothetical protein
MAKFHARPSLQYRYEHYDPQALYAYAQGWSGQVARWLNRHTRES